MPIGPAPVQNAFHAPGCKCQDIHPRQLKPWDFLHKIAGTKQESIIPCHRHKPGESTAIFHENVPSLVTNDNKEEDIIAKLVVREDPTAKYDILELLGAGTYGRVCKGVDKVTG
eukprot:g36341.t1